MGSTIKWSEAFINVISKETGSASFTHVLAVTKVNGNQDAWVKYQPFIEAMKGNPIKILTFPEMISDISKDINTTLASTEVGRMLQVIKASGIKI